MLFFILLHLHVSVDQPVELKVLVVIAKGVDQLLRHLGIGISIIIITIITRSALPSCLTSNIGIFMLLGNLLHLEESHEEEELENGEDREVKIEIYRHPVEIS